MDTNNKELKILPNGWAWKKLADAGKIISGGTPSTTIIEYWKGSINWIAPSDLTRYKNKTIKNGAKSITELGLKNSSARLMPKGSVLFSSRAPIGYVVIADEELCTNQGFKSIIPNQDISSDFLYYILLASKRNAEKVASGTTFKEISLSKFSDLDFPIPPKRIQQKIVIKIEELFSELEKGVENLLTAQQQLLVYRKAVIMQGVTGKLTALWRNKNVNIDSSEIFFMKIQHQLDTSFKEATDAAILEGRRKPKDQRKNKKTVDVEDNLPELPSKWKYYRLEDVTYLVTDGTHFTPKYQEKGVKFLCVKNVRPFYFREEHIKYISEEEHRSLIGRCNPQKNDILYTKVGATFGYAAKINMDYDFSIFVILCLIKPVYNLFSSDFLKIPMNSELVFQQARKRVSGSGVPDLHLIEIRDFKIPLPSLIEQNEIVKIVETYLSIADKMQENITQSLQQAEALRQSILKKAFEGKLI